MLSPRVWASTTLWTFKWPKPSPPSPLKPVHQSRKRRKRNSDNFEDVWSKDVINLTASPVGPLQRTLDGNGWALPSDQIKDKKDSAFTWYQDVKCIWVLDYKVLLHYLLYSMGSDSILTFGAFYNMVVFIKGTLKVSCLGSWGLASRQCLQR